MTRLELWALGGFALVALDLLLGFARERRRLRAEGEVRLDHAEIKAWHRNTYDRASQNGLLTRVAADTAERTEAKIDAQKVALDSHSDFALPAQHLKETPQ